MKEITLTYSDTGFTKSQEIHTGDSRWRVLRKYDNGTVEIISLGTGESINFGSENSEEGRKIAYKNYVGILNRIAKMYEKEGYTVGSRNVGYDPRKTREYLTDKDIANNIGADGGFETDVVLIREALGGLDYVNAYNYWLASRGSFDSFAGIGRYVKISADSVDTAILVGFSGNNYFKTKPIVILKSDLKITGGDGTASSPYTLGT